MKAKAMTKRDIGAWFDGSFAGGLKIETLRTSFCEGGLMSGEIKLLDGTTSIRVQFLNVTLLNNGNSETEETKGNGNE